jgi:hypothetical protein
MRNISRFILPIPIMVVGLEYATIFMEHLNPYLSDDIKTAAIRSLKL